MILTCSGDLWLLVQLKYCSERLEGCCAMMNGECAVHFNYRERQHVDHPFHTSDGNLALWHSLTLTWPLFRLTPFITRGKNNQLTLGLTYLRNHFRIQWNVPFGDSLIIVSFWSLNEVRTCVGMSLVYALCQYKISPFNMASSSLYWSLEPYTEQYHQSLFISYCEAICELIIDFQDVYKQGSTFNVCWLIV